MPLGPRAPLVSRLSQRAAPVLVRLLTSATWQPRGLAAGARLAETLSRRQQRLRPLSRFARADGQRLLLHLPDLVFALRRRRRPPLEPVERDAGRRWPRPAWTAAGPSVPAIEPALAGAPEAPAALPPGPAEALPAGDSLATLPVAAAPAAGAPAPAGWPSESIPPSSPEPGAALAGALLARHAAGWTLLLAETETAALAGPAPAMPPLMLPETAPGSAAGEPAGPLLAETVDAVEAAWPLVTADPGTPSHPLARVLARLPAAPGPASGGLALIDRPPLVLARAAVAVLPTMAPAGAGPRLSRPAEVPVGPAVEPAVGPALPAIATGADDRAATPRVPAADQPAAPWPLFVQPPPVAPALLAVSGLAGAVQAAAPGYLPLPRTVARQLRPVAADLPRSPAAVHPLRPASAGMPPRSPALSRALQPATVAERAAGEMPPLPMPLTPPVLPPAVSTAELEPPLRPGYADAVAGAGRALAASAGALGRGAPAGPFGWEPAFRAPATPPLPPAGPAADEPALPTVSRSLPLISPAAPLTLVPLSPGEAGPRASGGAGPLAAGADMMHPTRSGPDAWSAGAWTPAPLPLLTGHAPLVTAGVALDRQAAGPAWLRASAVATGTPASAGSLGAATRPWPAPAGAAEQAASGSLVPLPPLVPVWLDRAARRFATSHDDDGARLPTSAAGGDRTMAQPGVAGWPEPAEPAGAIGWPGQTSAPPPLALPSLVANALLPFGPARPAAPTRAAAPLPLLLQRHQPAATVGSARGDGAAAGPAGQPAPPAGAAGALTPWWPVDPMPVEGPAAALEPPPLARARAVWPAATAQTPLALLARRPAPLVVTGGHVGAPAAAPAIAGAPQALAPVARASEAPGPASTPLPLLHARQPAGRAAETAGAADDGGAPVVAGRPPAGADRPAAPATLTAREWQPPAGDLAADDRTVLPLPAGARPGLTPPELPLLRPLPALGERAPDPRRLAAQRAEQSHGAPLPLPLRAPFEHLFRTSFADVTVHTDEAAAAATGAVGAAAMTLGPRIFFAPGRYQPETPEGGALLAHELTHVVQQRTSPLRMALKRVDGAAAQPEAAEAEREAEATESRVRELYQSGGFSAQPLPLARAVAQSARPPAEDAASFVGGDYPGGPALGTDSAPALARIADVTYSNELARAEGQDGTVAAAPPAASADGARSPVHGPELRKLANEIFALIKEQLSYERERRGRWL